MRIPLQTTIYTLYKFESVHPVTGKRTLLADWSGNILLTAGKYALSQRGDWFTCCQVGNNNTAPSTAHTGLQGYVAGTSTVQANDYGVTVSGTLYGWRRKTLRFGVGTVSGNLSEVAIGWGTTDSSNITTRALIVDSNGDTTTVTPLIDELLDVTIEVRYYPPLRDTTGTVVFNGVTYDYIARACNVSNKEAWAAGIGDQIESVAAFVTDWEVYDGDIGATISDSPSGLSVPSDNISDYTVAPAATAAINVGMSVGAGVNDTDAWSITTGKLLRSLRIKTTAGWFQIQFDSQSSPGNGIPKTNLFTMQMEFILSWIGWSLGGVWEMQAASDGVSPTSGKWNTNLAETLLRINWVDDDSVNRITKLKAPDNTVFRMHHATNGATQWVEFTMDALTTFTEDTDWTEYTVTKTASGATVPAAADLCHVRGLIG